MIFKLPELPSAYDALEPHIDAETVEIHHSKHHATYIANLNTALDGQAIADQPIEYILTHLDELPADKRMAVKNNGGGYLNHSLFRQMMSPQGGGEPTGDLAKAISTTFDSFDTFKEQFTAKALATFGSGWTWLCKDKEGKLSLKRTSFQNNPIKDGLTPLLGIDVREHAYYLKHQNRRAEYIADRWNVVNRDRVAEQYKA